MNVLLIESQPLIAGLFRFYLETFAYIDNVYIVRDCDEFSSSGIAITDEDVIFISISRNGPSWKTSIDACKAYGKKEHVSNTNIVVLSSFGGAVALCIEQGVRGYLTKDILPGELDIALRTVSSGGTYIAEHLQQQEPNSPASGKKSKYYLSRREKEVLHLVCAGRTLKEAAFDMQISIHTVKSYYKSIMRKFDVHRTADLILFSIQNGFHEL